MLDSLVPVGRGQRELVLGDRKSGKTSISLDTTLSQEREGVACVCASIAARAGSLLAFSFVVAARTSASYVLGVFASAFDCASLQYLSPYTAAAASEFFMWQGHVPAFVALDDLSKHAVCYREIYLLLTRPPGREAYPGEIFFVHSRLLERAAKLSLPRGGGSVTAFPVIETLAADVSSYISTNVISTTDGQIFLSLELFLSNARPAVDIGLSVTRVGGAAQWLGVRSLAGSYKIEMAQYFELQSFAQFSADLGEETQRALGRGSRLVRLLCQRCGCPFSLPTELALLSVSLARGFGSVEAQSLRRLAGSLAALPEWGLVAAGPLFGRPTD
jgi:F-type H+-transporting ATPase subunit alpha